MLIKMILLGFIGLSAGIGVSSAVIAFVIKIGLVPRLAERTSSKRYVCLYEWLIILGCILGNIFSVYQFNFHIGYIGAAVYGLFTGVFVGCIVIALAEVLNSIPIMARRMKLFHGIKWVVLALALGKMSGALLDFFVIYRK